MKCACRNMSVGIGALVVIAAGATGNPLVNGGFETGDLTGWEWIAPNGGVLQVEAFAHSGTYSLKFGSGDLPWGNFARQYDIFEPGKSYAVEMWVYNLGIGDDFLILTDFGNYAAGMNPVETELETWEFVSLHIDFNDDIPGVLQLNGVDNTAAFYVDDISVTLVPAPGGVCVGVALLAGGRRRRNMGE